MILNVAVFASGAGSTLQALLDYEELHHLPALPTDPDPLWQIHLVISDREGAGALQRGQSYGRDTWVIPVSGRDPADVEKETLTALRTTSTDLVVLAGYLRLIPPGVVNAYADRMLNVHPALLPAFGGKGMYGDRVHEAVKESGAALTGTTVHLVDAEYDHGRPIARWPVAVLPGDSVADIRTRVQGAERALLPLAVDHLARCLSEGLPVATMPGLDSAVALDPDASEQDLQRAIRDTFP